MYHLRTALLTTWLKFLQITLDFTDIVIEYIASLSKQQTIYQINKTNKLILTQWQTSWFACYQCTTQSVEILIFYQKWSNGYIV